MLEKAVLDTGADAPERAGGHHVQSETTVRNRSGLRADPGLPRLLGGVCCPPAVSAKERVIKKEETEPAG